MSLSPCFFGKGCVFVVVADEDDLANSLEQIVSSEPLHPVRVLRVDFGQKERERSLGNSTQST